MIIALAGRRVDSADAKDARFPLRNIGNVRTRAREVLTEKPWKACACEVCRALGHHVILFRGAERNRRRGFHNVWVFYRRLQRQIADPLLNITRSDRRRVAIAERPILDHSTPTGQCGDLSGPLF